MPHRHEGSVLGDQCSVSVSIYASELTDVEPFGLEPANHVKFVMKKSFSVLTAGCNLLCRRGRRVFRCKTVPTVVVVSLPSVRRLHQNVGMVESLRTTKLWHQPRRYQP